MVKQPHWNILFISSTILQLHLCYVTHSPANEAVVNPRCHYFILYNEAGTCALMTGRLSDESEITCFSVPIPDQVASG